MKRVTMKVFPSTHKGLKKLMGFPTMDDLLGTLIAFTEKFNVEWDGFKKERLK